ncbi:MAG TPA: kelch repeat-containing protein [Terriglobales bacterium]|jgi:hypothetical protein|nr:kelch repeat-containing protein [Terriglobales bacterium]
MRVLRTLGIALVVVIISAGVAGAQWQPLQNQPTFNASTSLLLTDGTVMVHQEGGQQWFKLTPDINGSYVNGTWSQQASLPSNYSPLYYASAVLPDGRLIVEGGEYNFGNFAWTNLGAIYDPLANTWTPVNPPSGWANIGDAQSVVLPNGVFMLANALSNQQALLNASNLTWTATGTGKADGNDEEGWELLPSGIVLTVDANNTDDTHSEKYSPRLGKWVSAGSTVVPLTDPGSHEIGPAVLRYDGTVFAMGGTAHTAIYNTATGTWAAGPDFPKAGSQQLDMADAPAALLPNGHVLCDTSPGIFQNGVRFFEFDGTKFIRVPGTPDSRTNTSFEGRMLVLPTGQILFADGTKDIEIYTASGNPDPAWAPTIHSFPSTITRGGTFTISGTQLNGLSQGAMYGDDAQMATDYPLVRITNQNTGHVFYARTHNHSTMSVAPGQRGSTHFDVGNDVETGPSNLELVANGIASTPVTVTVQ